MTPHDKPLVWLHGEVKSPPFSQAARREAGLLLRLLQRGKSVGMPHARVMPGIGSGCHELRINDRNRKWRIVFRIDTDAIVILGIFNKKTAKTPQHVIDACRERTRRYDET